MTHPIRTIHPVTVNPEGPAGPPCPWWCTRPDLKHEHHRGGEWDFVEADGTMNRTHSRTFGEHVEVTGRETSTAPGEVPNVRIYVSVEDEFSLTEALQLAQSLLAAAEWLERHHR